MRSHSDIVLLFQARYASVGHGFWCEPMFKKHYERGMADVVAAIKQHGKIETTAQP
jgi:hypothetical protein